MRHAVRRISALLLVSAVIMTMLGGCVPVEDMLSPPRLTDEQMAIYKALTDSKGGGFKLKYPRTGEHRSAFVLYGEDESSAIVFYEISGINVERSLRMNFLYKNEDGVWESLHEMPVGNGTDIESVTFASFGEDEEASILLGYAVGQHEKRLMVINNADNRPVRQLDDVFSFMQVDYFFGNEYRELLVIKNDRSMQSSMVTLYGYSDGRLQAKVRCGLDPSAGEYTGVTQGYVMSGIPALFINHRKSDSEDRYGTDILYYRGSRLINPMIENIDNPGRVLRRTGIVTELANPRDINGDGIIEIPSVTGEFPGYSALPAAEILRPVIWRSFNGVSFTDEYYSYYTERLDYVFFLPARWHNNVTVAVSIEENTVSFYRAGSSIEVIVEEDEPLLTVKTIFGDEADFDSRQWVLFKEGAESGLKYYINRDVPDDPLALTEEELLFAFRILSEIQTPEDE
jgi:hypothetical protein